MNRYRGNMLLLELIFTLLVFSLSMTVILQVFATAQQKSNDSKLLSGALTRARDVAERLAREEHPDTLLLELGFMGGDGEYIYSYTEGYDLSVSLKREARKCGQLISASLTAQRDDKELFSLPAAFYLPGEVASP